MHTHSLLFCPHAPHAWIHHQLESLPDSFKHTQLWSDIPKGHIFLQMCPQLTAHVAVGSGVVVLQTRLGTGSKTTRMWPWSWPWPLI